MSDIESIGLPVHRRDLPLADHATSTREQAAGRSGYAPRSALHAEGGKESECLQRHESLKSQSCKISCRLARTHFDCSIPEIEAGAACGLECLFSSSCLGTRRSNVMGQEAPRFQDLMCAKCEGDITAVHLTQSRCRPRTLVHRELVVMCKSSEDCGAKKPALVEPWSRPVGGPKISGIIAMMNFHGRPYPKAADT
ncbi:hypothetical protein LMG27177_03561 [Paraburkholderia fynbosensis]|uniref:Uncharacterized protein n=1 Tax=Paraburkholderia fynbosensis TaxID=1200993 RepID=A0A6J5G904_9BURK|nr:hypothetical protein LMG27177_03561 [Paraburkholderia fynbosensis]